MKRIVVFSFALALTAPAVWAQVNQSQNSSKELEKKIEQLVVADKFHGPNGVAASPVLGNILSEVPASELHEVYAVLTDLNETARKVAASTELNNTVVKSLSDLYSSLVSHTATNPESAYLGDEINPRDEKAFQFLCAKINEPIRVGWGEKVVLSNYIPKHVDDIRRLLVDEEDIDKVIALSRVLAKSGKVPAMTQEETESMEELQRDLVYIRFQLSQMKEEKPLRVLQMFVGFYERFAQNFAANTDIGNSFSSKNKQLVKSAAAQMQQPIKVGWKKGKTIVMGSYIAEHLPEAYEAWYQSTAADELDTFNRDVLLLTAN